MLWLGIETKGDARLFSLGKDSEKSKYLVDPTANDDRVLEVLSDTLKNAEGEVRIRLRADKTLPIEAIKDATLGLQRLEASLNRERSADRRLRLVILGEVSEPTK